MRFTTRLLPVMVVAALAGQTLDRRLELGETLDGTLSPGESHFYLIPLKKGVKTSANLFSGVQLLTLSACNTGVGDGSEVEGFGALAQRQVAQAVIASLWPVAGESTSLLMREFYRARESSSGMTKADALREAQPTLLRGSGLPGAQRGFVHERVEGGTRSFAHPYYWASFFLMGSWL